MVTQAVAYFSDMYILSHLNPLSPHRCSPFHSTIPPAICLFIARHRALDTIVTVQEEPRRGAKVPTVAKLEAHCQQYAGCPLPPTNRISSPCITDAPLDLSNPNHNHHNHSHNQSQNLQCQDLLASIACMRLSCLYNHHLTPQALFPSSAIPLAIRSPCQPFPLSAVPLVSRSPLQLFPSRPFIRQLFPSHYQPFPASPLAVPKRRVQFHNHV